MNKTGLVQHGLRGTRHGARALLVSQQNALGFTLVELLTVIAIIAVLLAILIPTVSSAGVAAKKAETRVRFGQWSAAIAAFRTEYGFYPSFDSSRRVNGGVDVVNHPFHDVLAGHRRDGSALDPTSSAALQNRKAISFYSFTTSDFTGAESSAPDYLRDAFGTTDIVVLVDANLDGVINGADFTGSLPLVNGIGLGLEDFPTSGVHAGVLFYCALPRSTPENPQLIMSWK